ncbi:MAG: Hsp20/alpha crystallin family protein [Flavobacteriaceae bacterium]|jgi:HSP20 family protein|nr:Hsp20/alpha crystallin family protein [Flavobacteriaceae bacterium]
MTIVKRNNGFNFPSLIDEFLKPDWLGGMERFNAHVPAVNIKETDNSFIVELAAPGKKKEDFNIELNENILTISSEEKTENEEKGQEGRYTRKEFSYSSFKRAFTLPETVNEDSIKASYDDGVLHINLPKKEEALPKPKRLIEIG